MDQALEALDAVRKSASWNEGYNTLNANALKLLHHDQEDYAALFALASDFETANAELFKDVVGYIRKSAAALEEYEAYK
jgi:hypothetical protein